MIPAYNLPAYASQKGLPPATQDSVQNCCLGFVLATISGGTCSLSLRVGQRNCTSSPPQIRT